MTISKHLILGDQRGKLIAIESNIDLPFHINRVFYIYGNNSNLARGEHSHYRTKQYMIALNGSCKVTLDNGIDKRTYVLDSPNIGLFQDALVWGKMHDFTTDCILLVLADNHYDKSDYIENYDLYLKVINGQ